MGKRRVNHAVNKQQCCSVVGMEAAFAVVAVEVNGAADAAVADAGRGCLDLNNRFLHACGTIVGVKIG